MNSYEQLIDRFDTFQKGMDGFGTVAGAYKDEILSAYKDEKSPAPKDEEVHDHAQDKAPPDPAKFPVPGFLPDPAKSPVPAPYFLPALVRSPALPVFLPYDSAEISPELEESPEPEILPDIPEEENLKPEEDLPVMAADEIIPPDPEESIEEAEELVEPDPIPEEAIVDEADDENLPEEELPPMPDLSDPNRSMSPE